MEYSWLLISAFLVFLMQAGFLCLESGKIRSKNSINVAAKNISDFILAVIIFWAIGFSLMFGDTVYGVFGVGDFFFGDQQSAYQISFFIFQMMFCGTAATLLSGAVAERMTFIGYLCVTVVLCTLIYPISGHWAWASLYTDNNYGWLETLGFVDFAGSMVVHSVGGSVALAALLIIGPRLGRFDQDKRFPQGSNLPLAALGVLLIWLGWFGFNGGSTLILNEQVPKIILNTCIAAVFGGVVASIFHYIKYRFVNVGYILNGVIAGLVSITACCHAVSAKDSMFIGMIAGIILHFSTILLERFKIDDALSVVPAHLFAGIWGTLAVALFGDLALLATGLSRSEQLIAQLIGISAILTFSFVVSYGLLRFINYYVPLRVSTENEIVGMNITEHRASTELIDLLSSMEAQQNQGVFSKPVPEEPFTEVGQIAKQYNQVIKRVNQEINQRDNAITQFRSSEKRKSAILDSSMDSIITIDLLGNIIEFNPAAERTFGYLKKHVKGKNFVDLFVLEQDQQVVKDSLKHRFSTSQGLLRNRRNTIILNRYTGGQFPSEVSITSANFGQRSTNEFTLHIRDVTRQQKLQNKLKQLAYSDPLTGLYNRTYLMDSLLSAFKKAQHNNDVIMLFFLDLDRFKKINDTLGHKAGDDLLCEVAKRLIQVTRSSDIIARWGGDEFVVLMSGDLYEEYAFTKANDILTVMRTPMELAGEVVNIPTSVGIALSKYGSVDAEKLIQHADMAMYHAKQKGRDNFQMFEPDMAQKAQQSFNYEKDMRNAFYTTEQFNFVYQPKVTKDNHMVGLEALMRWSHPTEGMISPSIFIPIAEESDLIILMGERVIKDVLSQQVAWRELGCELVPISVNISGKHFLAGNLVEFVAKELARTNIDGTLLEIEITESVLLNDIESCIRVMTELKKLNVKISVDDFGTGYSSLNYLKRLPIDILKIDRSFVKECDSVVEDGKICSTIINLANNLDLMTVAEGVETDAQLNFLTSHGCDVFQGYLFYKPLSAKDVIKSLPMTKHLDYALS